MTDTSTASDATYHRRHTRRSSRRAECIASHIDGPASVLDVGCNIGITSGHLLAAGIASHVTGIELSAATVADELKRDSRFTLIEGDVTRVEPPGAFDVVIYGAVHHHIMNYYGLGAAVSALHKLAGCANRSLFFETGHLGEGGRWGWQRAIRRCFSSDEDHLHYLLSSIEHLMDGFEVIGRFWIHGVRRAYLRVDMKPPAQRSPVQIPAPTIAVTVSPGSERGRTFGSRAQQLLPFGDGESSDSPTWFAQATDTAGSRYFLKRHLHRPLAGSREHSIGSQVQQDWAVRPVGITGNPAALVFPLIEDCRALSELAPRPAAVRRRAADQLLQIFTDAGETPIDVEPRLLLPASANATLLDLCDLNSNNVLASGTESSPVLRIVDFEQQGNACRPRNRLHLARMLWLLRSHRSRAVALYVAGWAGLLRLLAASQLRPLARRIRDRQPGPASLAVTRVRSLTGRALGHVLRLAGIE